MHIGNLLHGKSGSRVFAPVSARWCHPCPAHTSSSPQKLCNPGLYKLEPTSPAHMVPCKCWIPQPSSCHGAALPVDGVSRGADGKFLLRKSTSGPVCSQQLPWPMGHRRVILPTHARAEELLNDQLLNPAFSVPAWRKYHCFQFHMERAVLGPSCRPHVPFPPKIIARAAASTAESVPAPTRIPVSRIGAGGGGVGAHAGSLRHPSTHRSSSACNCQQGERSALGTTKDERWPEDRGGGVCLISSFSEGTDPYWGTFHRQLTKCPT